MNNANEIKQNSKVLWGDERSGVRGTVVSVEGDLAVVSWRVFEGFADWKYVEKREPLSSLSLA